LGLTKEKPGFSTLTGVKRELEAILSQTGGKGEVHFDEAFTEQTLQNGLAQKYPVLHIASHFKFAAGTEADSFLLLGDGNKLSLQDVRRKYRFAGVDLLTLSACETAFGGGEDANGREVDGFATLAQLRGAKAVLATLWPVADESTSRLMQALYIARDSQKLSKAAALRQSQLGLLTGKAANEAANSAPLGQDVWRSFSRTRANSAVAPTFTRDPAKPFAHPYYWAPFILMGNWL
jgi:CHAT domain-containing protein